jgi:hypothetical protein
VCEVWPNPNAKGRSMKRFTKTEVARGAIGAALLYLVGYVGIGTLASLALLVRNWH